MLCLTQKNIKKSYEIVHEYCFILEILSKHSLSDRESEALDNYHKMTLKNVFRKFLDMNSV